MLTSKNNKFTHYLNVIGKYNSAISARVGEVCIFIMTLLVTVDVLLRASIGKSTLVAHEVSGYLLVAIACLGLSHAQRQGMHIEVTLLTGKLPQKWRERMLTTALFAAMVFMIWFAWVTVGPFVFKYVTHTTSLTIIRLPMWIPYLVIPVGLGMYALQLLIEFITSFYPNKD